MMAVTVDSKGRISIPAEVRREMGIEEGDTLFLESSADKRVMHLAKAINPFDALAEHAEEEYRAGRTRGLRQYAGDRGIVTDGE